MSEIYLGLISGTSMDAIDAALLDVAGRECRVMATLSRPISAGTGKLLRHVIDHPDQVALESLGRLDVLLGRDFAAAANELIRASGQSRNTIRAIGSHGQTVFHYPRGDTPFTMQLGDPNVIAEQTGITTVADFRRRDLAAGGQGAPLVPAFHEAVFSEPSEPRAICNIGGIANLTLLLPGQAVTGFDTGPGNTLMDAWSRSERGRAYDDNGEWAASAKPDERLLGSLLSYAYFHHPAPKSTGPEEFNADWLESYLHNLPEPLPAADVQSTLCQLTVESIAASLSRHAPASGKLYVCGGGAHNGTLMSRLKKRLVGWRLETTDALGIDVDWVEAAAFAWLASRTVCGLTGNAPAVTGARKPVILGGVYPA